MTTTRGICYTGLQGMLFDSVRRECEAEAIQDAELVRLVHDRVGLLSEPVLKGKYTYERSSTAWQAIRQQLYDLAAQDAA